MRDEARRRYLGKKARERVEEFFSWEAIARKTAELYREVCAG